MTEQITLEFIEEHEDGSASYGINMTKEMSEKCHDYGLRLMFYCGALGKSPDVILHLMSRELKGKLNDETL